MHHDSPVLAIIALTALLLHVVSIHLQALQDTGKKAVLLLEGVELVNHLQGRSTIVLTSTVSCNTACLVVESLQGAVFLSLSGGRADLPTQPGNICGKNVHLRMCPSSSSVLCSASRTSVQGLYWHE